MSFRRLKTLPVLLLLFCASTALAMAAALTRDDDRYLQATYGIKPGNEVVADMTPAERAQLHDLIHGLRRDPTRREIAVQHFLFDAYRRECDAWARDHQGEECRPAQDAAAAPGKEIADRICNLCHLFGSGMAPSFFRLAQRQEWDAAAIAAALAHSHDMVPISLPQEERDALARYINSLR